MNPMLLDTFLGVLVVSYLVMCGVFVSCQQKGANFIASFDKAFVRGGMFFVVVYGLSTVVYAVGMVV